MRCYAFHDAISVSLSSPSRAKFNQILAIDECIYVRLVCLFILFHSIFNVCVCLCERKFFTTRRPIGSMCVCVCAYVINCTPMHLDGTQSMFCFCCCYVCYCWSYYYLIKLQWLEQQWDSEFSFDIFQIKMRTLAIIRVFSGMLGFFPFSFSLEMKAYLMQWISFVPSSSIASLSFGCISKRIHVFRGI